MLRLLKKFVVAVGLAMEGVFGRFQALAKAAENIAIVRRQRKHIRLIYDNVPGQDRFKEWSGIETKPRQAHPFGDEGPVNCRPEAVEVSKMQTKLKVNPDGTIGPA